MALIPYIGFQMSRIQLTKIFMMISYHKKSFGLLVYIHIFQRFEANENKLFFFIKYNKSKHKRLFLLSKF